MGLGNFGIFLCWGGDGQIRGKQDWNEFGADGVEECRNRVNSIDREPGG